MGLIDTIEARCRDCYKCVRQCPVKAIRIKNVNDIAGAHRAEILKERCVHDGRCVFACPQQAKKVRSNISRVQEFINSGKKVVASVAPSFIAALPLPDAGTLVSALKKLGFASVQETAYGAELVAREHKKLTIKKPFLSSACPSIVSLVEKHFPSLIEYLSPIVSPMIAHGRLIKSVDPEAVVVFIGPCIAKREEAEEDEFIGVIDAVLDFQELLKWVCDEIPQWDQNSGHTEEIFDGPSPGLGRLFPLDGGLLNTSSMSTNMLDDSVTVISGLIKCMDFLKHLLESKDTLRPGLIELMACPGGCISGPMAASKENVYIKKQKVFNYYLQNRNLNPQDGYASQKIIFNEDSLYRGYTNKQLLLPQPTENIINEILFQIGKTRPEHHLNCGSCGYPTCRDKAVAVYQGIAELKMCIPYMRERAESLSNLVMAAMPNGIIIVNNQLEILEINKAARRMFGAYKKEIKGKSLSMIMEPVNFRRVVEGRTPVNLEMYYPSRDLVTREIIFPLPNEGMVVGILVDITEEKRSREKNDLVRNETIIRAQEVINKQMQVAQEIAGLLGETTAETKVLLSKLIKLVKEN